MSTICRRLLVTCVSVFASSAIAAASIAGPPEKPAEKPQPPKPEFPKFEEVMKDFTEVPTAEPPLFTLWYNKKQDSLRAQIPAGMVGKQFLIATSLSGGPSATGFQLDHYLAYFERMDKKLVLMQVDPRYKMDGDKPIVDVVRRSYGGDIILQTINIITMKGGDPVIDLDGVFKADFAGVGRFARGGVNPGLSKWAKYKAFPQNVELSADLAVMQGSRGRRILVHYSLSKIPDSANGYKPRVADRRIGYFLTVRKDWTKDYDSDTLFDRYIDRWRLEKRDPAAEFSAPKNPIIWYIEKTVPLQYRRWVKEGLLEWNKAFEKCGFLDAVEVIQQEDYDPRTKDLDPEDVRYNFFRWIATGSPFAMGPSRSHPFTGQIFDADIVCDDSFIRVWFTEQEQLSAGELAYQPFNPYIEDFFAAFPRWAYRSPAEVLLPNVRLLDNPDAEFRAKLMKHMHEEGHPLCDCAAGMASQMRFAGLALEAAGMGSKKEEFIGQMIKELVMHEAGHCLGLRHNFKASAWLPMEEILKSNAAGEATVGSVMDYNPTIIAPRDDTQGSFTTRTLGPYDFWAIEYGYRPAGKPYANEEEMLTKICQRVAEAGLDYATDDDTMSFLSPDPYSNRYDMGRDVIDFAKHQIKLSDSLLKDIMEWSVKDGQPWTRLRSAVINVIWQKVSAIGYVARFPGGQVYNRDQKGDPSARAPYQMIPAAKQREALTFVCDNLFAEDAFKLDPKLINHMAAGRWSHWGTDEYSFLVEFNAHDIVEAMQSRALTTLTNPFTIGRIHDNQVKFAEDEDVYTLAEHIEAISSAIWSELDQDGREGTERRPFINSFRRNLQRRHLGIVLDLVLGEPGGFIPADANAIARMDVSELSAKIEKTLKNATLDTASKAHLLDVKTRIDKALEAKYTVGGGVVLGGGIFLKEAQQQPREPITVLPSN